MRSMLLAATLLLPCSLQARPLPPAPPSAASPGALCASAIHDAEQAEALPAKLLPAIALVESGRRDPLSGLLVAWPWTIHADGRDSYFDTKAAAVAATQALLARGVRSIDVGCMQVNLQQHPEAFASLGDAFEPASNARYAARFLASLHHQTGDWTQAAALYHSATPGLGGPYSARVTAFWTGNGIVPPSAITPGRRKPDALAGAWAATLDPDDPVIMHRTLQPQRRTRPYRGILLARLP